MRNTPGYKNAHSRKSNRRNVRLILLSLIFISMLVLTLTVAINNSNLSEAVSFTPSGSMTVFKELNYAAEDWGISEATSFYARVKIADGPYTGQYLTFTGPSPDPAFPGSNVYTYTGFNAYGDKFGFSASIEAVIKNIPVGTLCVVEEIENVHYKALYDYHPRDPDYNLWEPGPAPNDFDAALIALDQNVNVEVENRFADINNGALTVYKALDGDYAGWGVRDSDTFTARVSDLDGFNGSNVLLFVDMTAKGHGYDSHYQEYFCVGNSTSSTLNYMGSPVSSGEAINEITFSKDTPARIYNLWEGCRYEVEELDNDGHFYTAYSNPGVFQDGASITVTNTYITAPEQPAVHEVGNLIIYKSLTGSYSAWSVSNTTDFMAKVWDDTNKNYLVFDPVPRTGGYWCIGNHTQLSDTGFIDAYSDPSEAGIQALIDDGTILIEVPFSAKNSVTLQNLWVDGDSSTIKYLVEEVGANGTGFTTDIPIPVGGITVPVGSHASLTITNSYSAPDTGSLEVAKALAGSYAARSVTNATVFTARVMNSDGEYLRLSGFAPNYVYAGTDSTGVELVFTAGQASTITQLPVGFAYTVEETGVDPGLCATRYTNNGTTLTAGTLTVTVTNDYFSPNTGGTQPSRPSESPSPEPSSSQSPPPDVSESPSPQPSSSPPGDQERPPHQPGGNDRDVPPNPGVPGRAIIPGDNGAYIELDEFGAPLGEWNWDTATGMWQFSEYPPNTELPQTGRSGVPVYLLILAGCTLIGFGAILKQKEWS